MAIGADRGIWSVRSGDAELQPLAVAKLLKALVEGTAATRHPRQAGHRRRRQPDRPDAGGAARLAAGTFASKVVIAGEGANAATVTREVDGGLETVEVACRRSSPPTCA